MSIKITPVFAVPFVQDFIQSPEDLNRALTELFLTREGEGDRYANPIPSLQLQPEVFESDFNLFEWPDACVQQLKTVCWTALATAVSELNNYSNTEILGLEIFSHSWFHITRRGGFTTLHTHPMASWSGVYCVSAGDETPNRPDSGILRFHNPHHFSNYFLDGGNSKLRPPFHHGTWNVPLKAGQLVLFPSWLQHEVMSYYGYRERITVAFNCWFRMRATDHPDEAKAL